MNQKILYLANIRLPTEKAHGTQIMKMCEAFMRAGAQIELVVTDRHTHISEDAFAYYGVQTHFPITRVPVLDTVGWGRLGFWIESLSFARAARRLVAARRPDIVYGRDELVLWRMPRGVHMVWEPHTGAWNRAAQRVARRAAQIIVISQGLKDFYVARGVPAKKIIVAHDAVDLAEYAHPESAAAARARLNLPLTAKLAMYAGRLDGWKGSRTLLEAAQRLAPVEVAIIGGEPAQVTALQQQYPHVHFAGFRPYRELADNLAAADVLVIPNTGQDEVSARFTSPLKLFAYMAAQKPIVAADLPSIREVLGEDDAYFFTPDDQSSLVSAIQKAVSDADAPVRAAHARTKVDAYTWNARAKCIIDFICAN